MKKVSFCGGYIGVFSPGDLIARVSERGVFISESKWEAFSLGSNRPIAIGGEIVDIASEQERAVLIAKSLVTAECKQLVDRIINEAKTEEEKGLLGLELLIFRSWESELEKLLQKRLRQRFAGVLSLDKQRNIDVCVGFQVVVFSGVSTIN